MFRHAIISAWPLFAGLALLMMGNGLQNTLLGVRASHEGFAPTTIGIVMSLYYVGYVTGTRLIPNLLRNVGHIRVFAALAAMSAAGVLITGLYVNPVVWAFTRIMTGLCYAGLYIVVESWLNGLSSAGNRGRIMAAYLLTTYIGVICGQFLLNAANPYGMSLFVLISILASLALVPISLSRIPAPEFQAPQSLSLQTLWHISPLGVFAVALSGVVNSTLGAIGPVYASARGFDPAHVSLFVASLSAGGILFQIPVGHLSDTMERRKILLAVTSGASLCALLCFALSAMGGPLFYLSAFLLGGTSMTVYGLCIAYTNDHLEPSQYVAAGSSMLMMNGFGAITGPFLTSLLMEQFGNNAFFIVVAVVSALISGFTMYRMTRRAAPEVTSQSQFHAGTADALNISSMDEN